MSRIIALSLACGVVIGCKPPKSLGGDPLVARVPSVGDKWITLSTVDDIAVGEETSEVTAVEHGALVVTTKKKTKRGRELPPAKTKLSDAGIFLIEESGHRYDPPICVQPKAIKEKDTWKWEKPGIVKWSFTAGPEEEVEVPAGKFKALRIDGEGESEGKLVKCNHWVLPGYPTIKTVLWIGKDKTVEILKSFTPGKKE
jgi:hypothetical protein